MAKNALYFTPNLKSGGKMASVNKAILIGNLGKDPELRYTPSGQAVASFPIATTERWRDKEGQPQENTTWHNIVAWGRQAEVAKEYLKKGQPVYIEGRIQNRSYDDKNGVKKWISEIVTQRLQLLGAKTGQEQGAGARQESYQEEAPEVAGDDDDLPF
jgi:single-strand DNA-binding protein